MIELAQLQFMRITLSGVPGPRVPGLRIFLLFELCCAVNVRLAWELLRSVGDFIRTKWSKAMIILLDVGP